MPLIRCPDCDRSISDLAPACIHCGRPLAASGPEATVEGSREAPAGDWRRVQTHAPEVFLFRRLLAGALGVLAGLVFVIGALLGAVFFPVLVGTGLGFGLAWFFAIYFGTALRWYLVLPGTVAGTVGLLILSLWEEGPLPEVLGFAVGAGLSYGLLGGGSVSLLRFALTPRRTEPGLDEDESTL